MAKKAKVDESRPYHIDQEKDFIYRPFSYQLVDHDATSLPNIPPSGSHGAFGAQHSKKRHEELETIEEKPVTKESSKFMRLIMGLIFNFSWWD